MDAKSPLQELVQISLLLEKCCSVSRKHIQKVTSAPRRVGGRFLVRRNAASNAAACVETTLTSSAGFTRLHLLPRRTFCSNVLSMSWQWPYILDHHTAAKYFVAFLNPGKLRQYALTQSDSLKLFTVKVIPTSGTFYFPASIMHFSMCAPVLKSIPTLLLLKFPQIFLLLDIQAPLFNHKNAGKMPFQSSSARETCRLTTNGKKLCMCSLGIILS